MYITYIRKNTDNKNIESTEKQQNSLKNIIDKTNVALLYLSRKLSNITDIERSAFITHDAGSKNSQQFLQVIEKNLLQFFEPKTNTNIYQNFIDEFFNPINFSVTFKLPQLKPNESVEGIDAQHFAFVTLNPKYYINNNDDGEKKLKLEYENRFKYMESILNMKVVLINEDLYNQSVLNNLDYFKMKLGFDFKTDKEDNISIKIVKKDEIDLNSKGDKNICSNANDNDKIDKKVPKYNLTKSILNKKK